MIESKPMPVAHYERIAGDILDPDSRPNHFRRREILLLFGDLNGGNDCHPDFREWQRFAEQHGDYEYEVLSALDRNEGGRSHVLVVVSSPIFDTVGFNARAIQLPSSVPSQSVELFKVRNSRDPRKWVDDCDQFWKAEGPNGFKVFIKVPGKHDPRSFMLRVASALYSLNPPTLNFQI